MLRRAEAESVPLVTLWPYLGVGHGLFKKLLEVFVALLLLVSRLSPSSHSLTVEDENMEEGIEEENDVRLNRHAVKQHGLRGRIECVGHQRWLNHDERIIDVFLVQNVSEVGR